MASASLAHRMHSIARVSGLRRGNFTGIAWNGPTAACLGSRESCARIPAVRLALSTLTCPPSSRTRAVAYKGQWTRTTTSRPYSTNRTEAMSSFYDLVASTPQGPYPFSQLKGKVVLIVNVASQWCAGRYLGFCAVADALRSGFTPQYKGLQALYDKYKDKDFIILGFPCNQVCHIPAPYPALTRCSLASRSRGQTRRSRRSARRTTGLPFR